jgi:hypothetical protein
MTALAMIETMKRLWNHVVPLRARREWPYGHAASQRYEIPTHHSITSSARASFGQPCFPKAFDL